MLPFSKAIEMKWLPLIQINLCDNLKKCLFENITHLMDPPGKSFQMIVPEGIVLPDESLLKLAAI